MNVSVVLTNRVAYLKGSYPYDDLLPFWSYSVDRFKYLQRYYPGWDGRIKLLKFNKVPAGLFRATRKEIESGLGIKFKVVERLENVETQAYPESDRDYQNACVNEMRDSLRNGGGLVLNATGSGKTRIAGLLSAGIKGHVCFVVDQLDLLEQGKSELETVVGEKIGYLGDSKFEPRRVTVATVQSIHRHLKDPLFQNWLDALEVVIIDEIHVQMNRRNFKSVESIQPKAVFGLTATLQLKKKSIRLRAYSLAGPVLYEYPLKRGMDEKVLAKGIVVRVRFPNPIDTYEEISE